jgi:hypothetical protein
VSWSAAARAKGRIAARQSSSGRAAIAAWHAKGVAASAAARRGRHLSASTRSKISAALHKHYGTTRRTKAHRRIAKKIAIHQAKQHRATTRRTTTRKAAKRR